MAKLIFLYLLLFMVAAVALKLLVVVLEPRLTFLPIRGLYRSPADVGIPFQEITIRTADGEKVYSWLLEHPESTVEVLFFHGNGGNLSLWQDFLIGLYHHSLSVFALDYRGYGKSTGSPTEEGLYRDTEALVGHFWDKVHRLDHKVIYWGRSLGGSIAAFATTIRKPDGLILEGSFPSKQSLLNHYPVLKILGIFSKYRFPTTEFLDGLSRPVLIIHGDQDSVIPFKEGQKLFEQLKTEKYFHTLPGANHNDLHLVDPKSYWESITQFIDLIGSGQDSH
ncbi:MAG: alpha/beta hydrolase [Acidobacteriota bacterium]